MKKVKVKENSCYIGFTLSAELKQKIVDLAEKEQRKLAQMIRILLAKAVK